MQINGPDWTLDISEEDLVRITMRQLKQSGKKITLQSVSQVSGLDVQTVKLIAQQWAAQRQAKEQ